LSFRGFLGYFKRFKWHFGGFDSILIVLEILRVFLSFRRFLESILIILKVFEVSQSC
jgi:hypothetical protein